MRQIPSFGKKWWTVKTLLILIYYVVIVVIVHPFGRVSCGVLNLQRWAISGR
jgi:polyferredoxin